MFSVPLPLVAVLGLACQGDPVDVLPASTPSSHDYDGQAAAAEPLALDQLEHALDGLIGQLLLLDPVLVFEAHEDIIDGHGDDGCPLLDEHNGQLLRSGACTTDAGMSVHGYTLATEETSFPHDDGRTIDRMRWVTGGISFDFADGASLSIIGNDLALEVPPQADGQPRTWEAWMSGEFSSTLPEHAGTLLHSHLLLELELVHARYDDGNSFAIDGSVSWLPGDLVAVVFDDVTLADRAATCGLEPAGGVRLRDAGGTWYQLAFDGSNADGLRTPECDGCGLVSVQGGTLGQVCADWAQLVAWQGSPW